MVMVIAQVERPIKQKANGRAPTYVRTLLGGYSWLEVGAL